MCDAHQQFTYISVQHPASASNYLAFVMSSLYQQLKEASGLPNGHCLYGDNGQPMYDTNEDKEYQMTKIDVESGHLPSPGIH